MDDFLLHYFILLQSEYCDFLFHLLQLTLNDYPHLLLTRRFWLVGNFFSSPTEFQDGGFDIINFDFDVSQ